MSTFLSYSRADSGFAIKLAKDLKSAGFDIWLDQLDIPTGARWDDEVETALESCKTFMIVLSPESLQSQNVKDEIGYAVDAGKEILPLKIKSGQLPMRLRRFQYVDFSKQSYQESLKEIKSILLATDNPITAKGTEEESPGAIASPTLKKIKPVPSDPISHPAKPTIKKPEEVSSTTPQRPISRILLIGAAAVAMLMIAGFLVKTFGAEKPSIATPSNEASIAQNVPTEQSTMQPTLNATQVSAPVEAGQSEAFLTTFSDTNDLAGWESSILGMGKHNKAHVSPTDDGLVFHLEDADLHAYYIYKSGIYEDVTLKLTAKNLGQNSYRVSLVCRKNDDTWYEFTVIGGGLWQLHEHSTRYILRMNGGTNFLNAGANPNEYEMRCLGNELTLRINRREVATYLIKKTVSTQGQVGFSVSSSDVFPIDMQVLEFEVSN